jgi:hypothetical protein
MWRNTTLRMTVATMPKYASCPFCRRGALHIICAIRQEEVTTRILRHLKLASEPPPIAPARLRQELLAFAEAAAGVGS